MFTHERINRKLETSELTQYVGKDIPNRTLRKILNKDFRSMGVRARVIRDSASATYANPIQPNGFYVSGVYHFDGRHKPITLTIHLHPEQKSLRLSKIRMNRLFFLVSETIQHEKIHQQQCRKRPKIDPEKTKVYHSDRMSKVRADEIKYLSDITEVDAYSHDICQEIRQYYPELSIREAFQNITSLHKVKSYKNYSKAFKGTNWDTLRKTLLRKAYKWMPQVFPIFQLS
jgi:hypothetical protein